MSNIVTVRDADVIAAEINAIKDEIRTAAIWASVKIGGKLVEAKSMVDHGQWGKWLEENVEYSQSTANYLMQLYQEYGTGQINLFDNWTNSQTFEKLSYSQHIALLALPFGERQAFAEENRVEEMSTRQLQQAIRERDEARQDLEDANREIEALKDAAEEKTARFEEAYGEREKMLKNQTARAEAAEKAMANAEKSEANALSLVEKYKKQLDEQKAKLENPTIPEDKMAQIRQEAEQAAAKKAAEKIEKQLAEATRRAQEAVAAREAAEKDAKAAREQLATAQKQTKLTDPALVEFNALAKKWQQDFAAINTIRVKLMGSAPETAGKMKKMLGAILGNMQAVLEE